MSGNAVSGEIQPYDSDHTALVHVLWEARRKGLTLNDFDEVASLVMRSKWLRAIRQHAVERAAIDLRLTQAVAEPVDDRPKGGW